MEGARRLGLDAAVPGLLPAGWARTGSFLTESGVCRVAWGSWAACGCPKSNDAGDGTSLLPGFSGDADDVASSVLLPEDTGREEAGGELRRPPNDNVGNDAGRGEAVVDDGGADGGAGLVCWLANEKLVLLVLRDAPPKLITPEEPVLVSGRVPKTLAEELPVLVLVAAGSATVVATTEEVTGGSECFPGT